MKPPYLYLILLLFSCISCQTGSDSDSGNKFESIKINNHNTCNYTGAIDLDKAFLFSSDNEAQQALKQIMQHTGLPTNFELMASDVANAAAVIYEDKRYILYNQRFLEDIKNNTKSDFASLSVLAHEIAHHLAGHTLVSGPSRHDMELEADKFSGFVLAKMGATMNEACDAMDYFGGETASKTHPAKQTRIAAIVNGWKEGMEIKSTRPSSPKNLHSISLYGNTDWLTVRSRSFTSTEFSIANKPNAEADKLNNETIVGYVGEGAIIELLGSEDLTYHIKVETEEGIIEGYISKNFGGKPTIKLLK